MIERRRCTRSGWWLPALALGASVSCEDVQVVAIDIVTIQVEPASATLVTGEAVRLEARLLDGAGHVLKERQVAWSSSDTTAATVEGDGTVRGMGVGQATITAESGDVRATAEIAVHRPAPTLTAVQPAATQRLQSVDLVLTGTGFVPGLTDVGLGGGITLGAVQVTSPTSLTVRATIGGDAQLGARAASVTVSGPGGGTATLSGALTVLPEHPVPTLAGAEPDAAQRRDEVDVRLTGSGFVSGVTTPAFGPDITVTSVQVQSGTALVARIRIGPDAALGSRAISVANGPPGGGTTMRTDAFTVLEENPAPSATRVLPESARRGTTLNVIVLGSGFVQGLTDVRFGDGITVNSVNVIFWTSLSANITIAPDAAPGPRNVMVLNPAPGGGTFIMNGGFTVLN